MDGRGSSRLAKVTASRRRPGSTEHRDGEQPSRQGQAGSGPSPGSDRVRGPVLHERHLPLEPLRFHIPRKENRALFQNVSVESREFENLQNILTCNYKDSASDGCYTYSEPRLVHSELQEREFVEKRKELKADGRTDKELEETHCFMLAADSTKLPWICEKGLLIGHSWITALGNPAKGVYLSKYSDLLQINPFNPGATGDIIIFKVMKGKVKSIYENTSKSLLDPTPKFDAHFSKNASKVTSLTSYRAYELTQFYFYEYNFDELRPRPRQVCPYAVVSFQFKGKTTPLPSKPLATTRLNSQSADGSKGRVQYTVWSGDLVKGRRLVSQVSLLSFSPPFLPVRLPEKLQVGWVMSLDHVTKLLPSAIFSWNLYAGSHEVVKNGRYCSLLEVIDRSRTESVLTKLLQKLESRNLVLVNPLIDNGFLFLLSSVQMAPPTERGESWKRCIQAVFVFPEARDVAKCTSICGSSSHDTSVSSEGPVMPRLHRFLPALHHALVKVRANPPPDLSAGVEHQAREYLSGQNDYKVRQYPPGEYDSKLDDRGKLFPAPKHHKVNMESYLRSYLYSPPQYLLSVARASAIVEQLCGPEPELQQEEQKEGTGREMGRTGGVERQSNSQKELADMDLRRKEEGGGKRKRKLEQELAERSLKYMRKDTEEKVGEDKLAAFLAEGSQSPASMSSLIGSAGLKDVDLRKDGSEAVAKLLRVFSASMGTANQKNSSEEEVEGQSEGLSFERLVSKLGLPTKCDIDLRKQEELEEQTAGSISSLEGFSPASHSGETSNSRGGARGGGTLWRRGDGDGEEEEEEIPWVLIPITGLDLKKDRERDGELPLDPRSLTTSPRKRSPTPSPVPSLSPSPEPNKLSPANEEQLAPMASWESTGTPGEERGEDALCLNEEEEERKEECLNEEEEEIKEECLNEEEEERKEEPDFPASHPPVPERRSPSPQPAEDRTIKMEGEKEEGEEEIGEEKEGEKEEIEEQEEAEKEEGENEDMEEGEKEEKEMKLEERVEELEEKDGEKAGEEEKDGEKAGEEDMPVTHEVAGDEKEKEQEVGQNAMAQKDCFPVSSSPSLPTPPLPIAPLLTSFSTPPLPIAPLPTSSLSTPPIPIAPLLPPPPPADPLPTSSLYTSPPPTPPLRDVDSIVEEHLGDFFSKIQSLLQEENVHYSTYSQRQRHTLRTHTTTHTDPKAHTHTTPHTHPAVHTLSLPQAPLAPFSFYVSFYNSSPPVQDYVGSLRQSISSVLLDSQDSWPGYPPNTSSADANGTLASSVSAFVAGIRAANCSVARSVADASLSAPAASSSLFSTWQLSTTANTLSVSPSHTSGSAPDLLPMPPLPHPPRPPPLCSQSHTAPQQAPWPCPALSTWPSAGHDNTQNPTTSCSNGSDQPVCVGNPAGSSRLSDSGSEVTIPGLGGRCPSLEPSDTAEPPPGPHLADTSSCPAALLDAGLGHDSSPGTALPVAPPPVISSLISQLQPEMLSSLVEIMRDVKKNSVQFYIHSPEEDHVYDEIKEYLLRQGNVEQSPVAFLDSESSSDRLLVIIQNKHIAQHIHKIPGLVSLKRRPQVVFVGVDSLDDIRNNSYIELFLSGGFIVSDEFVLNPDFITHERLAALLMLLEQQDSPESVWRWKVHCKTQKKLKQQARFKRDAATLWDLLSAYQKRLIVEFLPYHQCDMSSCQSPDLDCLIELQARYTQHRHVIFLTERRFEMFPNYSSSGIIIANIDEITHNFTSLVGYHDIRDKQPITDDLLAPKGLGSRQVSHEDSALGSECSPSLPHQTSSRLLLPPEQLIPSPPPTSSSTSSNEGLLPPPSEPDFEALRMAISHFRAERRARAQQQLDPQAEFKVNPLQSFLPSNPTPLGAPENQIQLTSHARTTLPRHLGEQSQYTSHGAGHTTPPPLPGGPGGQIQLTPGRKAVAARLESIHSALDVERGELERGEGARLAKEVGGGAGADLGAQTSAPAGAIGKLGTVREELFEGRAKVGGAGTEEGRRAEMILPAPVRGKHGTVKAGVEEVTRGGEEREGGAVMGSEEVKGKLGTVKEDVAGGRRGTVREELCAEGLRGGGYPRDSGMSCQNPHIDLSKETTDYTAASASDSIEPLSSANEKAETAGPPSMPCPLAEGETARRSNPGQEKLSPNNQSISRTNSTVVTSSNTVVTGQDNNTPRPALPRLQQLEHQIKQHRRQLKQQYQQNALQSLQQPQQQQVSQQPQQHVAGLLPYPMANNNSGLLINQPFHHSPMLGSLAAMESLLGPGAVWQGALGTAGAAFIWSLQQDGREFSQGLMGNHPNPGGQGGNRLRGGHRGGFSGM